MTKKYRIKSEAVPYISEKHVTKIYPRETWESIGIDINALEEVKPAFISYGRKTSDTGKTLSSWSEKDGQTFEFTIHFPSVKFHEHDKFSNGRIVRELMDRIQMQIDKFYDQFHDDTLSEN